MGVHNGSSVRRRMLARRLRLLREEAGLTLNAAAPALDWSVSKLSRIELAQVGVDVHGVRSMLDLYGADSEWSELVELARGANQRAWYRAYGVGDNSYTGYETEAVQVQEYAAGYVPGLLQVAEYSRALFVASLHQRSADELERQIAVRMIRQRRLTAAQDELRLIAIVAEAVLHNPVGGRDVLRVQLEHLLMVGELANVCLQVLPAEVGAHAAVASGFTVLSFGDLGEPDMAYVEHALGAIHLDKEPEVARARLVLDQLRSLALAPAESSALVERLLGQP